MNYYPPEILRLRAGLGLAAGRGYNPRSPVVTRIDMEPIAPRAEVTVYSPLFSPFRQQLHGSAGSIGRASDCSIPVKDRYLSRKHAEIVADHGSWILKDCGSANGAATSEVSSCDASASSSASGPASGVTPPSPT